MCGLRGERVRQADGGMIIMFTILSDIVLVLCFSGGPKSSFCLLDRAGVRCVYHPASVVHAASDPVCVFSDLVYAARGQACDFCDLVFVMFDFCDLVFVTSDFCDLVFVTFVQACDGACRLCGVCWVRPGGRET